MEATLTVVPQRQESAIFAETLKIALYGRYGSRKTLQIGSLIESVGRDAVVVVSAERGLNTIQSVLKQENVLVANDLPELRKAFAHIKEHHNTSDWWVCIDGGSQVMEWIATLHMHGADEFYDLSSRNLPIPDAIKPFGRYMSDKSHTIDAQKIYGRIGRDSEALLAAWVRLNCNLYVNYLEDMAGTSGREKSLPWGPDVPGKVGLKAVMSSFDYVGRLTYDSDGRLVGGFDARSPIYMARTREDRKAGVEIPPEIVEFTLAAFVRLIQGSR